MMTKTESLDSGAAVAEPGAPVAPEKGAAKKTASRKKRAPRRQKVAAGAKSKKGKKAAGPAPSRGQSKAAQILELIGRAKGPTLAEIMQVTSWQAHSVRGFISTAGNKHGAKIESVKNDSGARVYRIVR